MDLIYRKAFPILSYHLNPSGRARMTTLAYFFQEMAYQHANRLGFGYRDLKRNSTMWVLSRMKIEVSRYPAWDEVVTVETWHRGMERLFGMRDFRIRDAQGSDLALAESAWLIVDLDTRRPVRNANPAFLNSSREERVFDSNLEKISLPENMDTLGQHAVLYSDLDVVGHVNNVKYMEWCIDMLLAPGQSEDGIKGLEINFMHEAHPGETVIISGKNETQGILCFSGHLESDEAEVFRARLRKG